MPNIVNSTVVANAYTTSASARPQMLSNGWLISVVSTGIIADLFRIYKSEDNGANWTLMPLTFSNNTNASVKGVSVTVIGTRIHLIYSFYTASNYSVRYVNINAIDNSKVVTDIDTVQTDLNGMSIEKNSIGTELHACWSSKNASYPSSFNIRYAKGAINADGSVTWGSVEQVTIMNNGMEQFQVKNPSMILVDNNPVICVRSCSFVASGANMYYTITAISKDTNYNSSANVINGWKYKTIYDTLGGTYAQDCPSAIFIPKEINGLANGRIWVAWHGSDSTYSVNNIRTSYSDDGGVTWSAMERRTSFGYNVNGK